MDKPVYLLLKTEDVGSFPIQIYERTVDCDILVWCGFLSNLNEDEFPITGEITEEDLRI